MATPLPIFVMILRLFALFTRRLPAPSEARAFRAGWPVRLAALLCLPVLLTACGGGGDKASPPPQVTAIPGDTQVTLTWDAEQGVDYWIFLAPDPSISTQNFVSVPGARVIRNTTSPFVVSGLTNGTTYYFTINGRRDNGPGGSGSPLVAATPRAAGGTWTVGAPLTSANLNAVTFGLNAGFVTVGAGGQIFSSFNTATWTAQTSGVTTDLNGVANVNGVYVAVGNGGVTLRSADAVTWTSVVAGTQNLYGIVQTGTAYVAVGAAGTIITSGDATAWTLRNSGTAADLRGGAFGNGTYVVVGDNGTVLTSTDLVTWTRQSSGTSANLRAVTYGGGRFVAVGDQGTIITSTDAINWTLAVNPTSETLNAVVAGSQFVAVGANGRIVVSADGLSWTPVTSGTTATLLGLASGGTSYVAVGTAGTNLASY